MQEIRAFFAAGCNRQRCLAMLDLFGASGKMAARWREQLFWATSYDIKRHQHEDDITTRSGWFRLAGLGLLLLPGAMVFASPPCSDFAALVGSLWFSHVLSMNCWSAVVLSMAIISCASKVCSSSSAPVYTSGQ